MAAKNRKNSAVFPFSAGQDGSGESRYAQFYMKFSSSCRRRVRVNSNYKFSKRICLEEERDGEMKIKKSCRLSYFLTYKRFL